MRSGTLAKSSFLIFFAGRFPTATPPPPSNFQPGDLWIPVSSSLLRSRPFLLFAWYFLPPGERTSSWLPRVHPPDALLDALDDDALLELLETELELELPPPEPPAGVAGMTVHPCCTCTSVSSCPLFLCLCLERLLFPCLKPQRRLFGGIKHAPPVLQRGARG
jgi:hypothetical protein